MNKKQSEEKVRLQKYIASCGVASRRKAEELISAGLVKINGEIVKDMGVKVDVYDEVYINDKLILPEASKKYILLNKPVGIVTTANDEKGRKNVCDLLSGVYEERLYPVGRLDINTSGALIMTNDGDFAAKIMHPSCKVNKTYLVEIDSELSADETRQLKQGVAIEDYVTSPAEVKSNGRFVELTIHEGKNRQVRKMMAAVNKKVLSLKRTKIGDIEVGNLRRGEFRELTEEEVKNLW